MRAQDPSRTALGAAGYRAAHQTLDGGRVFADPFAHAILGPDADSIVATLAADPSQAPARLFMAARSRFAEDCLATAAARGVVQAVVLGAGLDTFALRNPHADLRVFEVDHPQTQAWKQARLAAAGLALPPGLTFAPVDFEGDGLADGLAAAGFRTDAPAVFVWLGVVPYLRKAAIEATLGYIAAVPDAEVIFDYSEPLENHPPARRREMMALAERAAAIGEPWLSHFDPADISGILARLGLTDQEDLGVEAIARRYLGAPAGTGEGVSGPHVIRARAIASGAA